MIDRPLTACRRRLVFVAALGGLVSLAAGPDDPIRDLQNAYVATKDQKLARAYHFGSQGPGDVFSNHTSHSNRLIPVYVFGTKADLGAVIGKHSRYRSAAAIKSLYGTLPPHTLNPAAEYCDQSDLHRVQRDAVAQGIKHLFIVWFDGLDWPTTRAAAIAYTGRVYDAGKGAGLLFQDYAAGVAPQYGYCVTSPTHDLNKTDVDAQTVTIPAASLGGGYDARIAGENPWTAGKITAPGYLKGQSANDDDKAGLLRAGGVPHAYTDSSQSAGEFATGVKAYNNGVNVTDDGRFIPTIFEQLQSRGWKIGTVTSVPFDHVSPAAMYAHNVDRDDYQDLAREMFGRDGIAQATGKDHAHSGLDVVIGAGFGVDARKADLNKQGKNAVPGNLYVTAADLAAIDVANGGKYVVAQRQAGAAGARVIHKAAQRAALRGQRLFGFFGAKAGHLPYRTADGDYQPAQGIKGVAEVYEPEDLIENPTLAEMTHAALTVLSAQRGQPFALFVEAGDVDFALHDNNLDNAIGAVFSGDLAVKVICDWVEQHSNWDESVLIVTADHGHYLVIDDPKALAGGAK